MIWGSTLGLTTIITNELNVDAYRNFINYVNKFEKGNDEGEHIRNLLYLPGIPEQHLQELALYVPSAFIAKIGSSLELPQCP